MERWPDAFAASSASLSACVLIRTNDAPARRAPRQTFSTAPRKHSPVSHVPGRTVEVEEQFAPTTAYDSRAPWGLGWNSGAHGARTSFDLELEAGRVNASPGGGREIGPWTRTHLAPDLPSCEGPRRSGGRRICSGPLVLQESTCWKGREMADEALGARRTVNRALERTGAANRESEPSHSGGSGNSDSVTHALCHPLASPSPSSASGPGLRSSRWQELCAHERDVVRGLPISREAQKEMGPERRLKPLRNSGLAP
ncbi:hypothetical protein C8Q76DRAFT_689157 [Earliella scabrosa]|nr:hypothetical protein C8Q76DRAFT_689157 [Earliella scabrosa]